MQWRPAVVVSCGDVRAPVEEQGGDGGLRVVPGREMQRRPAVVVSCGDVRATVKERRDGRCIRVRCRIDQFVHFRVVQPTLTPQQTLDLLVGLLAVKGEVVGRDPFVRASGGVCALFEEQGDDGGLCVERRREVQRCHADVVSCGDVCATVEEQGDDGGLRVLCCTVQRRPAVVGPGLNIRALVDQQSGDGGGCVVRRSEMQWCPAIVISRGDIRAAVQQQSGNGWICVVPRRGVQRRPAEVFGSCFDIRAAVQQPRDLGHLAVERGPEQFQIQVRFGRLACAGRDVA